MFTAKDVIGFLKEMLANGLFAAIVLFVIFISTDYYMLINQKNKIADYKMQVDSTEIAIEYALGEKKSYLENRTAKFDSLESYRNNEAKNDKYIALQLQLEKEILEIRELEKTIRQNVIEIETLETKINNKTSFIQNYNFYSVAFKILAFILLSIYLIKRIYKLDLSRVSWKNFLNFLKN